MRAITAWPLLAALLITACGDGTAPAIEGTFEGSVSGAVSADMAGSAEFGTYTGEGFGLSMQSANPLVVLGIGQRREARPAVGSYPVGQPEEEGVFFAVYMQQTPGGGVSFVSQSGEFTITASSEAELVGSFQFSAVQITPGHVEETQEIWVTGTFQASCARGARCD
jgi:hypothetical protein